MPTLKLDIITQEKPLLSKEVDQVTAPAVQGEVTILPGHIPLFTRLDDGVLAYTIKGQVYELALLGGFMDVAPGNHITVLADTAILADEASEAKAEAARQKAEVAMQQKVSEVEFKQAEIALRKALLELKVARRRRTQQIPQT